VRSDSGENNQFKTSRNFLNFHNQFWKLTLTKIFVLTKKAFCSRITATHMSFKGIGVPGWVDVLVNKFFKTSLGSVANLVFGSEIATSEKSSSPRCRPQPGHLVLDWKWLYVQPCRSHEMKEEELI
jgi:hypothetical protein